MTRTSTQDLQEEFLTALNQGQKTMIGALRIWVETVQAVTPKLTGMYAPLTDRLPKLPSLTVPFADRLPSPHQAVDSAYGLAGELLANQRKFAEDVLDTTAVLLPGSGRSTTHGTAPKPAAKAPQPAASAPKASRPAAAAAKPAAPKATTPKATTLKPAAPKAAAPKATTLKPAAPKATTSKPAAPKATTPTGTPSTKPAS